MMMVIRFIVVLLRPNFEDPWKPWLRRGDPARSTHPSILFAASNTKNATDKD